MPRVKGSSNTQYAGTATYGKVFRDTIHAMAPWGVRVLMSAEMDEITICGVWLAESLMHAVGDPPSATFLIVSAKLAIFGPC